jgi:hypothetical protein
MKTRTFALALGCMAAACHGPQQFHQFGSMAFCTVDREVCAERDQAGNCLSVMINHDNFTAQICFDASADSPSSACNRAFCTAGIDAPSFCKVTIASQGTLASSGVCSPAPVGNGSTTGKAAVSYLTIGYICGPYDEVGACTFRQDVESVPPVNPNNPNLQTVCVDVSQHGLLQVPLAPPDEVGVHVLIGSFSLDDASCTPPTNPAPLTFDMTPGPVATGSGNGTTATATALRGQAQVLQVCDAATCAPTSLTSLRVDLANTTIAGATIANAVVTARAPAPVQSMVDANGVGFTGIPTGGLTLNIAGKLNGVDSGLTVRNTSPWRLDLSATSFRLRGLIALDNVGQSGASMPVTVSVDAPGVPATAQSQACAGQTGLQRLFGFEDAQRWTSAQATLSLATSPLTQGCGALGVAGQGFMPITGAAFTTRGLVTNTALSVDLFVPSSQPNPSWTGALQMYLSCPSGNVFNQFIGQVELTGKPQNHYSTLRFPLPSATRSTLARALDDCAFAFALNVNETGQLWLFDNLRFTP